MPVTTLRRNDAFEIVQTPARTPGAIGRSALLLGSVLLAGSAILIAIAAVLFRQRQLGALDGAEFWFTAPLLIGGAVAFVIFGLWELSIALPRRIVVTDDFVRVRFALPIPFSFAVPREGRRDLRASVYQRKHRNYAIHPSGAYSTLGSVKSYVRYGGRLIGPIDDADAERLAKAINAALEGVGGRSERAR